MRSTEVPVKISADKEAAASEQAQADTTQEDHLTVTAAIFVADLCVQTAAVNAAAAT